LRLLWEARFFKTIDLVELLSKKRNTWVRSHSTLGWILKARRVSANKSPMIMKMMI